MDRPPIEHIMPKTAQNVLKSPTEPKLPMVAVHAICKQTETNLTKRRRRGAALDSRHDEKRKKEARAEVTARYRARKKQKLMEGDSMPDEKPSSSAPGVQVVSHTGHTMSAGRGTGQNPSPFPLSSQLESLPYTMSAIPGFLFPLLPASEALNASDQSIHQKPFFPPSSITDDLDFACEMTCRDVTPDPKSPTQPTQGIPQSNVYSEILDGEDYKWAFDTSFSDVPHSWAWKTWTLIPTQCE